MTHIPHSNTPESYGRNYSAHICYEIYKQIHEAVISIIA